jgi:RNA polymerase sigma factor (sigma-70 family)
VAGWFADLPHHGGVTADAGVAASANRPSPDPRSVLEAAYDAHQREIYSFALRSTRDPDAAEDIAQEAFVRLLRELTEGRPPDNVRAWLYRVASNLAINAARRTSALDRVRHIVARPEATIESPERSAVQRERDRAVEAALRRLSPDARTGLLLAAKGFSGREIAEAIGRSELATRSLMCRARLDLREQLEAFDPLGDGSA